MGLSALALVGLLWGGGVALMRDLHAPAFIVGLFVVGALLAFGPGFLTVRETRHSPDALPLPAWQSAGAITALLVVAAIVYTVWFGSVSAGTWALLSGALLSFGTAVRRGLETENSAARFDASLSELRAVVARRGWRQRWSSRRSPPRFR